MEFKENDGEVETGTSPPISFTQIKIFLFLLKFEFVRND
jgi:hypothetical protein